MPIRKQTTKRRLAECEEWMVDAIKGIKVLRNMCRTSGLGAGVEAAERLLDRVPLLCCDICGTPTPNKAFVNYDGTDTLACDQCLEP